MMAKKKKTKKEMQEREIQKLRIIWGALVMGAILILGIIAINLSADTITFKFKSPISIIPLFTMILSLLEPKGLK